MLEPQNVVHLFVEDLAIMQRRIVLVRMRLQAKDEVLQAGWLLSAKGRPVLVPPSGGPHRRNPIPGTSHDAELREGAPDLLAVKPSRLGRRNVLCRRIDFPPVGADERGFDAG